MECSIIFGGVHRITNNLASSFCGYTADKVPGMSLLKTINFLTLSTVLAVLISLFNISSEMYPDIEIEYPSRTHITLYIDRAFTDREADAITECAWEWSRATNHIVEYDIVRLPSTENIKHKNSLFFVKTSIDDPTIILMDEASGSEILGHFQRTGLPHISLVMNRINEDNYKSVILHEIGHSLGIKHLEGTQNINTLMYPYQAIILDDGAIMPAGSDHITRKDLEAFCALYHCDAKQLKH